MYIYIYLLIYYLFIYLSICLVCSFIYLFSLIYLCVWGRVWRVRTSKTYSPMNLQRPMGFVCSFPGRGGSCTRGGSTSSSDHPTASGGPYFQRNPPEISLENVGKWGINELYIPVAWCEESKGCSTDCLWGETRSSIVQVSNLLIGTNELPEGHW